MATKKQAPLYAANTTVSVSRSKAEIESILERYGASQFGYVTRSNMAAIAFFANDRQVRFELPLPEDDFGWKSPKGRRRTNIQIEAAQQQETKRRWRALTMAIKAKLEVVASGIATFEEEFLAHIVTPDGRTFGAHASEALTAAYENNEAPQLLLGPGGS